MGDVNLPELYFLVADFLARSTPCQRAATILREELTEHNLLGLSYDWQGHSHHATPEELSLRYRPIPRDQLPRLLRAALQSKDVFGNGDSAAGGGAATGEGASRRGLGHRARTGGNDLYVASILTAVRGAENPRDARDVRYDLLRAFGELSEANHQLRRVKAAIANAEEKKATNKEGDLITRMDAMEVESNQEEEQQQHPKNNGMKSHEIGGGGQEEEKEIEENDEQEEVVEVMVIDQEGGREMGEASRERVQRELEDRIVALQIETVEILTRARQLHALRTQETHEVCRTIPDMVMRRQGPFSLPRHAKPLASVYARLRHLKTISGHLYFPVYCIKYDKRGHYIFSGADDNLVKLWSVRTGRLMRSLRSHAGVITDLTVSPDNSLLATASEDRMIRIWNVTDGTPLATLRGHTDTINYVHFHPFFNVLLSGSDDGSTRAWDLSVIKDAGAANAQENGVLAALPPDAHPQPLIFPHIREPANSTTTTNTEKNQRGGGGAAAASAASAASSQPKARVKCVSLCPLGSYVATGADDALGRIWSILDLEKGKTIFSASSSASTHHEELFHHQQQQRSGVETRRRAEADLAAAVGAIAAAGTSGGGAAAVQIPNLNNLVCRLQGHKKAVTDISYSHGGDRLFTGSMVEGVVRIWSWSAGYTNLKHVVLSVNTMTEEGKKKEGEGGGAEEEEDAGEAYERRRTGRVKATEGFDNAVWTCDDKLIVTAQSTRPAEQTGNWKQCLKVWNSTTGELLCSLRGHQRQTNVLVPHPSDPRIVMSAGYDGKICLWDVVGGRCLYIYTNRLEWGPTGQEFSIDDLVPLVDGQFSADGWSMTVTDGNGRLLLFGPEDHKKFDQVESEQYFVGDYDQLQYDVHGNALDASNQVAPHLMGRRLLTSSTRIAYVEQPQYEITGPCPLSAEEMKGKAQMILEKARGVYKMLEVRAAKATAKMAPSRQLGGIPPLDEEAGKGGRSRQRRGGGTGAGRGGRQRQQYLDDDFEWGSGGSEGENQPAMTREERMRRRAAGEWEAGDGQGGGLSREQRMRRRRGAGEGEGGGDGMRVNRYGRPIRGTVRHSGQSDDSSPSSSGEEEEEDYVSDSSGSYARGRRLGRCRRVNYNIDAHYNASDFEDDDSAASRRRRQPSRQQREVNGRGGGGGGGGAAFVNDAIDPVAEGIPVERDEFDMTIIATTLIAPPIQEGGAAAEGGEEAGGEGSAAANGTNGNGDSGEEHVVAVGAASVPPFLLPGATREVDRRTLKCAMCGQGHSESRPLPGPMLGSHPLKMSRGAHVWVHDDCAHWSPRTFQGEHDDRWYNIALEVRRGRTTRCRLCNKMGATIGCHYTTCQHSFHYPCAVETVWNFTPDTAHFLCTRHRPGTGGGRGRRRRGGGRTLGRAPRTTATRGGSRGGRGGGGGRGGRRSERRAAKVEDEGLSMEEDDEVASKGDFRDGVWHPGLGMELNRAWLRVTRQDHDLTGRLVPQVGDSVIYFPRVHQLSYAMWQAKLKDFEDLPPEEEEAADGASKVAGAEGEIKEGSAEGGQQEDDDAKETAMEVTDKAAATLAVAAAEGGSGEQHADDESKEQEGGGIGQQQHQEQQQQRQEVQQQPQQQPEEEPLKSSPIIRRSGRVKTVNLEGDDGRKRGRRWRAKDARQEEKDAAEEEMNQEEGEEEEDYYLMPWDVIPEGWTAVRCRVQEVQYLYPESDEAYLNYPSIVCRPLLKMTGVLMPPKEAGDDAGKNGDRKRGPAEGAASGAEGAVVDEEQHDNKAKWIIEPCLNEIILEVDVRDDGGPSFLALDAPVLAATNHPWAPGMRVKAPYLDTALRSGKIKESFMTGAVTAVSPYEIEAHEYMPSTANKKDEDLINPYRLLEVEWDPGFEGTAKPSTISPWEAVPVDASETLPLWEATVLPEEEQEVCLTGLSRLVDNGDFRFFFPEIEFEEYPTYPCAVPLHMEYSLIIERLEKQYYRSLEAVGADIKHVALNCGLFNVSSALIVKIAQKLKKVALDVVRKAKRMRYKRFGGSKERRGGGGGASVAAEDDFDDGVSLLYDDEEEEDGHEGEGMASRRQPRRDGKRSNADREVIDDSSILEGGRSKRMRKEIKRYGDEDEKEQDQQLHGRRKRAPPSPYAVSVSASNRPQRSAKVEGELHRNRYIQLLARPEHDLRGYGAEVDRYQKAGVGTASAGAGGGGAGGTGRPRRTSATGRSSSSRRGRGQYEESEEEEEDGEEEGHEGTEQNGDGDGEGRFSLSQDFDMGRRQSDRLATNMAIAASLTEVQQQRQGGGRRGARAKARSGDLGGGGGGSSSVSSSTSSHRRPTSRRLPLPPPPPRPPSPQSSRRFTGRARRPPAHLRSPSTVGPTVQQQQQQQQQTQRPRRLRIVSSAPSSSTPSPKGQGATEGDGQKDGLRRNARKNVLRIRLMAPLGAAEEEEGSAGPGPMSEDDDEGEEGRGQNKDVAEEGEGGRQGGVVGGEPFSYQEPPAERLAEAIQVLLQRCESTDVYQVLSVTIGAAGGGGAVAGFLSLPSIQTKAEAGEYKAMHDVEVDLRCLLEGLLRESETIYRSEAQNILNQLPQIMTEVCNSFQQRE